MSLSGGASGGKGIDANPVETYDSGDEWDIGVGNLIIDLDADLEKDQQKLEMSGSKDVGLPAPNAVATLPDNIKFVSPVPGPQGKEGKSKSKRSKSGKDSGKPTPATSLFTPSEGGGSKKEAQGRSGDSANSGGLVPAVTPKGSEKSAKASRSVAGSKKEKEGGSSKSKKERSEGAGAAAEKEPSVLQPLALAVRVGQYDGGQGPEPAAAEQLGSIAIDTGAALNPLGAKAELEDGDGECRQLKKVKAEKVRTAPGLWVKVMLLPCSGGHPSKGSRRHWHRWVAGALCNWYEGSLRWEGTAQAAPGLWELCVTAPSCRTLGALLSVPSGSKPFQLREQAGLAVRVMSQCSDCSSSQPARGCLLAAMFCFPVASP